MKLVCELLKFLRDTLLFQNLQIIQEFKGLPVSFKVLRNLEGLVKKRKDTRSLRYCFFLKSRNGLGAQGGGQKNLPTSLLPVFLFTQDYYGNIST